MLTKDTSTASADTLAMFAPRRTCPHVGGPCLQGEALCARLCAAVAMAGPLLGPEFDLRGEVHVTTCTRPCRLAFRSRREAAICLCDAPLDADLDGLFDAQGGAQAHCGAVVVATPPTGPLQ